MNPNDPPRTLGVFSPVGHVVISFPSASDADAAAAEIAGLGLQPEDITVCTPEEIKARVEIDLAQASPIANLGQEVNLARAHGALAERGYSFLIVNAPKNALARQVADIAREHHAERAQHYGRFVIEELIDEPTQVEGAEQVFESPDRGLDAQTTSGHEKERSVR